MTGWLIALGILFLLAILPLGVNVSYDENGFFARVIVGFIRFVVFPIPAWMKKKKPEKQAVTGTPEPAASTEGQTFTRPTPVKKKKKKRTPAQEEKQPAGGGSFKTFLPWIRLALDFLGDFRRKLRLNHVQMKLILAGDDPCDLAMNYGRAWAALGNLVAALDKAFVIKKRDLEVECDFVASETKITADFDITITLGRLLALAAVYGVRALREFFRMKKNKKGGAAV